MAWRGPAWLEAAEHAGQRRRCGRRAVAAMGAVVCMRTEREGRRRGAHGGSRRGLGSELGEEDGDATPARRRGRGGGVRWRRRRGRGHGRATCEGGGARRRFDGASKGQNCVSLTTVEAEYIAARFCMPFIYFLGLTY